MHLRIGEDLVDECPHSGLLLAALHYRDETGSAGDDSTIRPEGEVRQGTVVELGAGLSDQDAILIQLFVDLGVRVSTNDQVYHTGRQCLGESLVVEDTVVIEEEKYIDAVPHPEVALVALHRLVEGKGAYLVGMGVGDAQLVDEEK